jgi:sugar phosphate isomerase/epimerase
VLPGEGVTRPHALAGLLRAAGFDGYVDIEIFSTPEDFWGLPVDEAARRAAAAARSLITQS